MNVFRLLLVIAVAGLYGCSDKDDAGSSEGKTSLIEKAGQMSSGLADKVKQGAADAGKVATESLDKAADNVGDAVETVKEAGSRTVETVVDASRSLTAGTGETGEAGQDVAADAQTQVENAGDEIAAAAASGQALTAETVSGVTSGVADTTDKTVEAAGLEAASAADALDPAQVATGKTVYSKHCMACHAAGVAGAPKVSDAAVWAPRIAQGMETLYGHAINGFQGSSGVMPAKGGFSTLSDDEVKSAVAYMVSASQ